MPMPSFRIHQAVPFVGQRGQRFRQQSQTLHPYRRLPRFRQEESSLYPQDIPQIEKIENGQLFLRERRFLDVNLQPPRPILQVKELALPHIAMGHHPPCQSHLTPFLPPSPYLRRTLGSRKRPPKRIHPQFAQLSQLLPPYRHQVRHVFTHRFSVLAESAFS